jgi:hypothetical protein
MTALFTPSVTDALLHLEAGAEALSEYRDYSLGVRDELDARWRATAQARQPALVASRPEPVPVSAHAGNGQAQGRSL